MNQTLSPGGDLRLGERCGQLWNVLVSCSLCPLSLTLSPSPVPAVPPGPCALEKPPQQGHPCSWCPGGCPGSHGHWWMSSCFSSFHLGGEGQRPQLPQAVQEEICLLPEQEEILGEPGWASLPQPLIPEPVVAWGTRQRCSRGVSRGMESHTHNPQGGEGLLPPCLLPPRAV